MEPGEGVVSNAGYLVSRVVDVIYRDYPIAILDTSASAHMPDVLEMPYRPSVFNAKKEGEALFTYELTGCSCLSGDRIGKYSFETPLKVVDPIIFCGMAPYTMVKNTHFNGISLPSIHVLDRSESLKTVKKCGFEISR